VACNRAKFNGKFDLPSSDNKNIRRKTMHANLGAIKNRKQAPVQTIKTPTQ